SSITKIFFLIILALLHLSPASWLVFRERSSLLVEERQAQMECGAFAFLTLDPEASSMPIDYFATDGKTQAQPWIGFLFRIYHLVEALENLVLVFFGDAKAKILHPHEYLLLISSQVHNHRVSFGRILDGIGQQIDEHLPQAVPISKHVRPALAFEAQVMGLGRFLNVLHNFLNQ